MPKPQIGERYEMTVTAYGKTCTVGLEYTENGFMLSKIDGGFIAGENHPAKNQMTLGEAKKLGQSVVRTFIASQNGNAMPRAGWRKVQ